MLISYIVGLFYLRNIWDLFSINSFTDIPGHAMQLSETLHFGSELQKIMKCHQKHTYLYFKNTVDDMTSSGTNCLKLIG